MSVFNIDILNIITNGQRAIWHLSSNLESQMYLKYIIRLKI